MHYRASGHGARQYTLRTHWLDALADAYAQGAREAGHAVKIIAVAQLDFPLLRTKDDFDYGTPPPGIRSAQEATRQAHHLLILYPLWLGTMPALLKGFLEQVFRPVFAAQPGSAGRPWQRMLTGKSAHVAITMGMPGFVYRWYYGAHSLKNLERNILGFAGIRPVHATLVGMVEAMFATKRGHWLAKMCDCGRNAR